MVGFLELFFLAVIAAIVVVLISIFAGRRSAKNTGGPTDVPVCGACGYATRGLTELVCPECGADLTEVGIVMPGDGRSPLAGCLWPLLTTAMIFLLAVGGSILAVKIVPAYEDQSTSFDLGPDSDAYSEVVVETDLILIIPAGQHHHAHNFDITTQYGSPNVTTVDFGGGKHAKLRITAISLELMSTPAANNPGMSMYAPRFIVDTETGSATWTDAKGKTQTSSGPVKNKDLLAYFAEYNVDTTRQDVVLEVGQLTSMIDGLLAGKNQIDLRGFEGGGYGSGSTGSIGPIWASFAYVVGWFVIWIVALVVVSRMARKRRVTPAS